MPDRFHKLAILGGGLLGGSLALASPLPVSLWARREETVRQARERGISSATADLGEALAGADLVVLGVPVGAMRGLLERALEVGLEPGALVTDVGSVKEVVHRELGPLLAGSGHDFIGGHPMAGSEARGIEAGREDLFDGAFCLLTDDGGVGDPAAARLEGFWRELGCRVRWLGAAEHDRLVARISHFPHVMASATALVAMERPGEARFGGGGLRDTTRVAGGDAAMWAEILIENREAVAQSVERGIAGLGEMLAMLRDGEHEALREWLERARQRQQEGARARAEEGGRT